MSVIDEIDKQIQRKREDINKLEKRKRTLIKYIQRANPPICKKCGGEDFEVRIYPDLNEYSIWSGRTIYLTCKNGDCGKVYEIAEEQARH